MPGLPNGRSLPSPPPGNHARRRFAGRVASILATLLCTGVSSASAEPPFTRSPMLDEGRFAVEADGRSVDGQVVEAPADAARSTIAILPDRTTGADWGLPHLARAVDDLNLLRPDAVFCVGDLVQGYTRDLATWDREVDDYLRIVGRLDADFWPTAGNHDVISGERDASDRRFADRYRRRFGPLHYAVRLEHGTVVVLFSDESLDGGDVIFSDEQREWLDGVLAGSDPSRPTVLLMHRPLWRYRDVKWFERVHPMLVDHGVDAVVAGHFHALQRDADRDGIQYHLLGVCGGAIDQHPLTGQFNHLSLLDLGPGDSVHVRHLPTGVMLADDFITRADQERCYRLKSNGRSAQVEGVLPDPRHGDIDQTVEVVVRNPIDRPIRISVEPATAPGPWLVPGQAFIARTLDDIANPATTDLDTPFRFESIHDLDVAPGDTRRIPVRIRATRTDAPPPPPEIRITARFTDDREREVPIMLPRRIGVERTDDDLGDGRPAWPIAAWTHSVYEEREPLGELRTTIEDGRLAIDLAFHDDRLADDDASMQKTIRGRRNPHGDLVAIELEDRDGQTRRFLFEPADGMPGDPRLLMLDEDGDGFTVLEGAVRRGPSTPGEPPRHAFRIVLPEPAPGDVRTFQVEVADNDRTYHTQWRRLAPRGDGIVVGADAP